MKLKQPAAPFERLEFHGDSVSLDTEGKTLVIPTGNPHLLPGFNEYTLSRSGEVLEIGTYTLTDAELQYMIKPWIALYDPAKTVLNFFLFTHKPKKLQYTISNIVVNSVQFQTADGVNFVTADETNFLVKVTNSAQFQTADGVNFVTADETNFLVKVTDKVTDKYITQLILFPGNGLIYYGQITHCDLTRDTDSDLIPDILGRHPYHFVTADGAAYTTADGAYFDFSLLFDGSVTKFLEAYGMVI